MSSAMITRAPVALRLQASSCEDVRRASGLPANPRTMFAKQRAALVCAPRRQPTLTARKFQVRAASSKEDMIEQMMKEAMSRIDEDPAKKEDLKKMVMEMQAEKDKDPEAFDRKVKQMQQMQSIQFQSFLMQVMLLDEHDMEVGYVVKDIKKNGEQAFQKYLGDDRLTGLLQEKCTIRAVVEQLQKIEVNDAELGYAVKGYNEKGDEFVKTLLTDMNAMKNITLRAVLDDPYSLHGATRMNDLETMKYLMDNGVDANAPGHKDINYAAPLHIACSAGFEEAAEMLLDRGAELNLATPDTQGNSPLHFAVGYGQIQMIEFLLNKGANKYATNSNGQMPSEMAELLSDENMRRQTIAALN
mmetsp:Transcript_6924/g.11988  ORF Transcript_6924/g.11988 Transcript_6924/m.11988 type:complete len:358 (-) Transcript_6924:1362-2435(-)